MSDAHRDGAKLAVLLGVLGGSYLGITVSPVALLGVVLVHGPLPLGILLAPRSAEDEASPREVLVTAVGMFAFSVGTALVATVAFVSTIPFF